MARSESGGVKLFRYKCAFSLEPGDLITTARSDGIGRVPPVFLKRGDLVRCEFEGIGVIKNRVGRGG